MKRAFTMIELIFAIVIIGILSAIAAPKIFATREDAKIARAKSDVAAIRSGIANMYNANMLRGEFKYPATLDKGGVPFGELLQTQPKGWSKVTSAGTTTTYKFAIDEKDTTFIYNSSTGSFDCNTHSYGLCKALRE